MRCFGWDIVAPLGLFRQRNFLGQSLGFLASSVTAAGSRTDTTSMCQASSVKMHDRRMTLHWQCSI